MAEKPLPTGNELKLSRRDFSRFATAIFASMAVGKGLSELADGVTLGELPVYLQSREIGALEPISTNILGLDGNILSISDEKLLFDPSGTFFVPHRKFDYAHRTNRPHSIGEAYDIGANLFDIDANNVNGVLYAEHGLIPQLELELGRRSIHLKLPIVVDVNERGAKLGKPRHTYEKLIEYVASLSDPEYPLAVSTELKRGVFDIDALYQMFDIHQRYNVPVMMHAPDWAQLSQVVNEIATSQQAPG